MKPKTIEEFCGAKVGSFKDFLQKKQDYLRKIEGQRKERVKVARACKELSWAA
jgi:hypothetical protein